MRVRSGHRQEKPDPEQGFGLPQGGSAAPPSPTPHPMPGAGGFQLHWGEGCAPEKQSRRRDALDRAEGEYRARGPGRGVLVSWGCRDSHRSWPSPSLGATSLNPRGLRPPSEAHRGWSFLPLSASAGPSPSPNIPVSARLSSGVAVLLGVSVSKIPLCVKTPDHPNDLT